MERSTGAGGDTAHAHGTNPLPRATGSREVRGERRTITVLFCDVANSTALAEQLDPEDWAEIMNRAFQHLTAPINRYEGTVARLMGDAVLAFFGAPVTHEDDPQRAVLAALDILDSIGPFREEVQREYGLDFTVRIGINSGPVVVGDVGSSSATEYTAMGDAVNVAARMEQTAVPGTVQLSSDTYRLVAPLFDIEPLGEIEVKGKSDRVAAYRVLGVKAQPGRLRGFEGVSAPLIGRDREFTQLKNALERLRQGRGQIVCIIGEAGLGKSRLLEELHQEWVQASPPDSWEVTQGIPYDSSRPHGLFQNFARNMFGIELDDAAEVIHEKVDAGMRADGVDSEAIELCSVAMERIIAAKVLYDAPDFSADVVKQDIYEMTYPAWRETAAAGPVVMVVDDLHWADQASVDLLAHLFRLTEEVPILFLCAFRPERQAPAWQLKLKAETDYPHRYTEIALDTLGAEDADALVSALLSIADLPSELRRLILGKTEGNPYFIEEIVRTLIEQGVVYQTDDGMRWKASTNVDELTIPDSLQTLLMARIDRLGGGDGGGGGAVLRAGPDPESEHRPRDQRIAGRAGRDHRAVCVGRSLGGRGDRGHRGAGDDREHELRGAHPQGRRCRRCSLGARGCGSVGAACRGHLRRWDVRQLHDGCPIRDRPPLRR